MTPDPIQTLIHRHLDGATTPEETSRLALALAADPAAARAYAEATRLEAGLRGCFEAEAVGRRLAETARLESPAAKRGHRGAWGAVAAAVVAAGLGVWWWRPWGRVDAVAGVAEVAKVEARRVADVPGPPPAIRRPGELSAAAREMKRLAARYWLPERLGFSSTPLAEAVAAVQRQAAAVNHLHNPLMASFAIDLPEEVADVPVSATRGDLPMNAWLELLSAQAGCDLRYTETGVAFEPVDQPDRVETRDFPLPTVADATATGEAPARLFSYAPPWDSEPDFRSTAAHGPSLAAAWGFAVPPEAKIRVREDSVISVRHTRRELRRFEGLVAVAAADAGRPSVTFRAQEVMLPAPASVTLAQNHGSRWVTPATEYGIDLFIPPEVVEFEGFVNYGEPLVTQALDANGQPTHVLLTESRIEQPVFAARAQSAAGSRVVGNDEAAGLLAQGPSGEGTTLVNTLSLSSLPTINRSYVTYDAATLGIKLDADSLRRAADAQAETVVESELPPDPWQQAAKATVKLGEQAWISTSVGTPITVGEGQTVLGFDLEVSPPPPLNATARLEGEMVKMTGTFLPSSGGGAPTDFEAHVGPGQALVLQTEDAPAVQGATADEYLNSGFAVTREQMNFFPATIQLSDEASDSIRTAVEDSYQVEMAVATTFEVAYEAQGAEEGSGDADVAVSGTGASPTSNSAVAQFSWQDVQWKELGPLSLSRSVPGQGRVRGVVISPVVEWR